MRQQRADARQDRKDEKELRKLEKELEKQRNFKMGPFLAWLGPKASWLRRWWVLTATMFFGAVVAAFAPAGEAAAAQVADAATLPAAAEWPFPEWEGWLTIRVAAGVLAALAAVLDRIADTYEAKAARVSGSESERSAERALDNLNVFISEAIETSFLEGTSKQSALVALKRTLARCAAGAVGDGSRASFYPLKREKGGLRILQRPSHHTEAGRWDKPDRPFIEREDPDHEVWQLMERADEEPEVRFAPQKVYGVNWGKKKYKTFYSVPVKADQVQLGFLSVNNSEVGRIGGVQRSAILAMARTMALVVADAKGPRVMRDQASRTTMSAAGGTVEAQTEEVAQ